MLFCREWVNFIQKIVMVYDFMQFNKWTSSKYIKNLCNNAFIPNELPRFKIELLTFCKLYGL